MTQKIGSTNLFIHQSGYPTLRNSFLQDNLKGKVKGTEKIENLLQKKEKLIHKSIGPLDKIFRRNHKSNQ